MTQGEVKDIGLLYLIDRCGGIQTRIRLQKFVCIAQFTKGGKTPFSFNFHSHYYGPYSENLRKSVDQLVARNLVRENVVFHDHGGDDPTYSFVYDLTKEGKIFLGRTVSEIQKFIPTIDAVITKFGGLSNGAVIQMAKRVSGMESV